MIRKATPDDETDVRACAEEAYEQYVVAIGKKPAPMVADFGAQISRGCLYVACQDAMIEGFIVFFQREDHMFLENVAVRKASSGKGLGKILMAYCEAEAKRARLSSIELYTNEKMTANLSIYPHLGYKEFDRREEDGFHRVYYRKLLD